MLSRKIAQYSWRTCQFTASCNKDAPTSKDFSFKKVLLSIVVAFFIVVVIAGLLNFLAQAQEKSNNNHLTLFNQLVGIPTAVAADYDLLYRAEEILRSDSRTNGVITMRPAGEATFTIGFKNIGLADWHLTGPDFASVYTANPNYRRSQFEHPSWYRANQPSLIKSTVVKPNQLGFFSFKLKAPNKVGEYTEYFRLAVEDTAWIRQGIFKIKIIVQGEPVAAVKQPSKSTVQADSQSADSQSASQSTLIPVAESQIISQSATTKKVFNSAQSAGVIVDRARPFIQSAQSIEFKNKQPITFQIGYKNTGIVSWTNAGNEAVQLKALDATTQSFYDSSWLTSDRPAIMSTRKVQPGQIGFFKFKLRPGRQSGSFTLNFALTRGADREIADSRFSLPVTVFPEAVTAAYAAAASGNKTATSHIGEPVIRVGLYKLEGAARIKANSPYEIRDNTGRLLATLSGNQVAVVSYQDGQYQATANGLTFTTTQPIRLVAQNGPAGVLEIINYENRPKWNLTLNDNKFRNILEINYSAANDKTWVINELPMEYYLKGLAESSNISHLEYQKALVIAARSYAYYHYQKGTKHAERNFTVDANYDQVYRGYGAEIRLPKVSQAVEATRGMVVTYNNQPVITPYFSQSDGRTRFYNEVWGGPVKPWLVSVKVPSDVGNKLWGHGVGMSCRAAINMANSGMNYQEILKYFYRGTALKKIY